MTIPAWPFKPDWRDGILESLEWKTAIFQSPIGAEQRRAVRIAPRRSFEIPYVVEGYERSYFESLLMSNQGKTWYVPIPHEAVALPPPNIGDTVLFFLTQYREFTVGGKVLIRGNNSMTWEIVTVNTVTDQGIIFDEPVTLAYNGGITVSPCFLGRLTENVTNTRYTGTVYAGTVRFQAMELVQWPLPGRALSTVPTYTKPGDTRTYPILTQQPNAVSNLNYNFERMMQVVDDDIGIPYYTDTAGRSFRTQQYEFYLIGANQRSDFRDWLFRMFGRRNLAWVPTFNDDLSINLTYPDPFARLDAQPGREVAVIFGRNGSVAGTTAVGPETSGSGFLSAPMQDDTIRMVSWMTLMRLDQDRVEIMHQTALNGAATCSLVLRDAPSLRVEADLASLPYANTMVHHESGDVPAVNGTSDLNSPVTIP